MLFLNRSYHTYYYIQARLLFCSVQDGRINKEYIIMTMTMTVRLLPGNTQQSYMTRVSPLLYYSSRSHSFKDLNASPFFRKAGAKISTFIISLQIFPELFFRKVFLDEKTGSKNKAHKGRPGKPGTGSALCAKGNGNRRHPTGKILIWCLGEWNRLVIKRRCPNRKAGAKVLPFLFHAKYYGNFFGRKSK